MGLSEGGKMAFKGKNKSAAKLQEAYGIGAFFEASELRRSVEVYVVKEPEEVDFEGEGSIGL